MSIIDDNEHIKKAVEGEDFTIPVDSEFRERLINELRHFPNIFVIAGDSNGATHTHQGNSEELGRAIIHIFKQNPELFEWFKKLFAHV